MTKAGHKGKVNVFGGLAIVQTLGAVLLWIGFVQTRRDFDGLCAGLLTLLAVSSGVGYFNQRIRRLEQTLDLSASGR